MRKPPRHPSPMLAFEVQGVLIVYYTAVAKISEADRPCSLGFLVGVFSLQLCYTVSGTGSASALSASKKPLSFHFTFNLSLHLSAA